MYSFHPSVVVRLPRLAFEPVRLTEENLKTLLHETWFLEALFLASPDLYRTAIVWREGATFPPRKHDKLCIRRISPLFWWGQSSTTTKPLRASTPLSKEEDS